VAEPGEIYSFRYSSDYHFPMVHSYSPLELGWRPRNSPDDPVEVPDVTLVAHAEVVTR
jgi:hypothetical protein